MKATRSLVVAPNWVGDNVMAIPVLDALAASERSLTVLARPHLVPLLDLLASVDEVVPRPKKDTDTIATLKSCHFEECIVLPNSFRSAWLPFRAGIPVRWGYRGDFRSALLEPAVRRPAGMRHQTTDYDSLLERMGVAIPAGLPAIALGPEELAAGEETLRQAGIDSGGSARIVGLFPGAEFGPSKRWPPESFAELASRLASTPGVRVLVIAGPGEEALAAAVRGDGAPEIPILGPELDLAELASVLATLDVLVTNDSGPMHIADAMGTHCVALFGPTNPARTAPRGEGSRLLYTERWCSPCFRKRCPLFHQRCLRDLSAAQVHETVNVILEAYPAPDSIS
ncbi:MAG: lipopolysaccharide heptosyltransferase II [Thermoanaerobaculia bacterium]